MIASLQPLKNKLPGGEAQSTTITPHLRHGSVGPRCWTLNLMDSGVLSMHAVYNNPYWGGGLLCLLRVKRPSLVFDGEQIGVNDLNAWGNLVSDTPTFGAWCSEGDDFVFVQFVPNFMKALPGLMDLLVAWARARTKEAGRGHDHDGNRWTRSRWQGFDTFTGRRPRIADLFASPTVGVSLGPIFHCYDHEIARRTRPLAQASGQHRDQ